MYLNLRTHKLGVSAARKQMIPGNKEIEYGQAHPVGDPGDAMA
jgi:hypothetical protein